MPILSHPAFGPRTALGYVTGGALMCVWTAVWYYTRDHELSNTEWFWVAGFFLTGTTFIILGLILGPLGRAARQAEMPPVEVAAAEAAIQQTAAAHPPAVVAPQPAPGVAAVPPAAGVPAQANPAAPTTPRVFPAH